MTADEHCKKLLAPLLGASPDEIAVLGGLTANLHLMLVSCVDRGSHAAHRAGSTARRPSASRSSTSTDRFHLIRCSARPRRLRLKWQYAFETQVAHHGLDLDTALVPLKPRDGEHLLRTEDILAAIEREGDSLALVMFSGIQYYTGQLFDMRAITAAGHSAGAIVGWDLAHAVGNVPLQVRLLLGAALTRPAS